MGCSWVMVRGLKTTKVCDSQSPTRGKVCSRAACVGGGCPWGQGCLHTQSVPQRQAPGLARGPQRLKGLQFLPGVGCGY